MKKPIEVLKKFNTDAKLDERTGDLTLRVDVTAFAAQTLSAEAMHLARLNKTHLERECLDQLHRRLTDMLYGEVRNRLREMAWEARSLPPSQVYELGDHLTELARSLEWKPE